MISQFNQPRGSTSIEVNKQSIARNFGVKENEVVYFTAGIDLGGFKVIYDESTQRAYSLPSGIVSGTTAISLNEQAILTHSAGSVDLGELAVSREEYVTLPGSFSTGATVDAKNELVVFTDGKYRWDGALPKEVPADSTPTTTGGVGDGAWVSVGDASLRSDLSSPDGDSLINHGDKTVQNVLNELLSVNVIDSNESPIASSKAIKTIKNLAILQTGQSLAEGGVGYDQSLINQSVLNTNSFTLADGPVGIASAVLGTKLTNLRERIRSTIGSTLADKLITSGISKKTSSFMARRTVERPTLK